MIFVIIGFVAVGFYIMDRLDKFINNVHR